MEEIEKSFQETTELIFGKKLCGVIAYSEWLKQGFPSEIVEIKSKISKKNVSVAPMPFYIMMNGNLLTLEESLEHGKKSLSESEVGLLSVENATSVLKPIKSTTPEIIYGTNLGSEKCACYGPTRHCFSSSFCWFTDKAAYSFLPRTSLSIFGCWNVIDCQFSIRCSNSTKLTRCFEVSDSNNCKDSYFCYNCEGLDNCILCFNVKSKRYAVANIEVGREKYLEIKKIIVEKMWQELSETKKLKFTVASLTKLQ